LSGGNLAVKHPSHKPLTADTNQVRERRKNNPPSKKLQIEKQNGVRSWKKANLNERPLKQRKKKREKIVLGKKDIGYVGKSVEKGRNGGGLYGVRGPVSQKWSYNQKRLIKGKKNIFWSRRQKKKKKEAQ